MSPVSPEGRRPHAGFSAPLADGNKVKTYAEDTAHVLIGLEAKLPLISIFTTN